jgi:hypothetical protein
MCLPPANGSDPSGIPMRTAARTERPSKRVPEALQSDRPDRTDRTDRQETRERQKTGDSPLAVGERNAFLVSVADGLFDRKIERVEGLFPVLNAPFARLATSSTGGGAALTSG